MEFSYANLFAAFILAVFIYFLFYIYLQLTRGVCRDKSRLNGKTVVITGADKGIGYATALELARRNARVIIASRDSKAAAEAVTNIKSETGNTAVLTYRVDMSSLKSIREFAKLLLEKESRIDVLINNAGILASAYSMTYTEEGFEVTLATNYLGPFLLTHLLLDRLKACAPSRVINVSSKIYAMCSAVEFDYIAKNGKFLRTSYPQTKLALNLFTLELSKKLESTGVTVNCLHPGIINTNLFHSWPFYFRWLFANALVRKLFFRTCEDGAQTSVYLSVSPDVCSVSGKYFASCRQVELKPFSRDEKVASKLYEHTARLVGL